MPKVITREKDLTSAGSQQYRNFTVLVPGYIDPSKAEEFKAVKDENDVYEVSSIQDFKKNVGLIQIQEQHLSTGAFAVVKKVINISENDTYISSYDEMQDFSVFEHLTFETVSKNNLWDSLYYISLDDTVEFDANPATANSLKKKGYFGITVGGSKVYYKVKKLSSVTDTIIWDTNPSTKVTAISLTPEINGITYDGVAVLSSEGYDGVANDAIYHYGNKMAAELLALGYTVLYKQITSLEQLEQSTFWEPLKDKSMYDFRYVVTGLIKNNYKASQQIFDLCKFNLDDSSDSIELTGRGDCYALIDIDESIYGSSNINQFDAVSAIKGSPFYKGFANEFGKYATIVTPSVEYEALSNNYEDDNTHMPASFHYLACAAKALRSFNEWYAVAGYNRGISDLVVKATKVKFGDYAVNALQPRKREEACSAINVICKIRNSYYLWGNRTAFYDGAESKSPTGLVASDFLNIRQLCTTIKKQLYFICRRFTFDPNSDVLWVNFVSAISPLLEQMKADQGLEAYKIVKIQTNQKGKMMARIRIVPIEAVEDFDICLTLEDSVSGTVVSFND